MPSPSIFSYSLIDKVGVKGTADFFVSYDADTETVAALLGAAAALGGMLDVVTAARISQFNVKINALPDPGWKAAAIADVDMEQTLLENFAINDSRYLQAIDVPCLRDTLIGTDGRPILTPAGAIDTLNQAIIHSTGITGVAIQSKFLENLLLLADYAVTFRKHRKGRVRVSKVVK